MPEARRSAAVGNKADVPGLLVETAQAERTKAAMQLQDGEGERC